MIKLESLKRSKAEDRIRLLAAHDLFNRLEGDPYTIQAFAAFYTNQYVDNNDLMGIYNRLLELSDNSSLKDDLAPAIRFQKKAIKNKAAKRLQVRGKGI